MKNASVGLAISVLAALALAACSSHESGSAPKGEEAEAPVQKGPSSSLSTGNAEAGEKLAKTAMGANNKSCIECHGPNGNHPDEKMDPRPAKIGGQYRDYIAHALQSYRAGERKNLTMDGQAKDLTDQQISDLAEYFGTQEGSLVDLSNIEKK